MGNSGDRGNSGDSILNSHFYAPNDLNQYTEFPGILYSNHKRTGPIEALDEADWEELLDLIDGRPTVVVLQNPLWSSPRRAAEPPNTLPDLQNRPVRIPGI